MSSALVPPMPPFAGQAAALVSAGGRGHVRAGRRFRVTLAVLLLAATVGCRPAEQRAEMEVARADQLTAQKDMGGALQALGRATALDANNVDAWVKLGTLQLRAGDATSADQSFQRAQELAPDNIAALENLVILSIRGGDVDRAKRYLDALLVLQPDDPAGLLGQGAIALRERKPADALATSGRLVANYPDIAESYQLRARALAALGRPKEADDLLEKWLVTHPGDPGTKDVLLLLLDRYRADGDVTGIRSAAVRLHALLPDDPRYALETARAYRAQGKVDLAEDAVQDLLRAHPNSTAVTRAVLAYWRDVLPPADARTRTLALAERAGPAVKIAVANSLTDAGLGTDALGLLTPLAGPTVTAETVDAAAAQARAFAALGRTAEARRRADEVLGFDPGNVSALLVRARLSLAARQFEAAIADAQLAVSNDATSEAAAALVAQVYAAQGNQPLAQQAYALAIQRFADSYGLLSKYLDWLSSAGRRREAMQLVGSFARHHRRSDAAWRRYADLCRTENDPCLAEAQARPSAA